MARCGLAGLQWRKNDRVAGSMAQLSTSQNNIIPTRCTTVSQASV